MSTHTAQPGPSLAFILKHAKPLSFALGGLILLFVAWFGYQEYRSYTIKQASLTFARFVNTEDGNTGLANQLINSDTPYAPLAALLQARVSFINGNPEDSKALLLFTKRIAQEEVVRHAATAYLAQVEWQLGDSDAALAQLDALPDYLNYYKFLTKGDIYAAQKNSQQAESFYKQAIDFATEYGINADRAELRINSL